MSGRCSGACCAVFWLPHTPDELRARTLEAEPDGTQTVLVDAAQIADMVIPLTPAEATARAERFEFPAPTRAEALYTCRHWDEDTRLCTIYADRPGMCRGYPYGKACDHGCGFAGGREPGDDGAES